MTVCDRASRRLASWTLDETWSLGLVPRPIASFLARPEVDPREVRWIEAPRGSYYADPFGLPGEDALLCERFDHFDGVGRLVRLDLAADGAARETPAGLGEGEGHASFPYLVPSDAGTLCLPETAGAGRLRAYRRSGAGWAEAGLNLPAVRAIDPALFPWGGRWWLAFTPAGGDEQGCLHLWHAPAVEGPWAPHAANPVKRGRGGSRMAGTPFVSGGRLFRPAQDCSSTYGGAVVVHEVRELDPATFAEEPAVRVEPPRGQRRRHGLHSLCAWDGPRGPVTLIDAKRHHVVPAGLAHRVRKRARQALARRSFATGARA